MDEHLSIGVFGKGKGYEFPLDISNFSGFETEANVKCRFRGVSNGDVIADVKESYKASSRNDSINSNVDLDNVDHVYLRKHRYSDNNDYDVWKLNDAEITIYGTDSSQKRTFHRAEDLWRTIEHGLKVWLKEE